MLILASPNQMAFPEILLQLLMLVAVVAIGLLLTISIRGKIARRNAKILPPREQIVKAKTPRFTGEDKHAISAHLHDTARKLSAQMDNKAERLEQLLEEADRKLQDLQQVMGGLSQNAGRDASPPPELAPPPPLESVPPPLPPPVYVPDQVPALSTPAPVFRSEPEAIPESLPIHQPIAGSPDPLTHSVYELADSGHDTVSIARELDEQIGKVELILALRAG